MTQTENGRFFDTIFQFFRNAEGVKGKTVAELARHLDENQAYLYRVENQDAKPDFDRGLGLLVKMSQIAKEQTKADSIRFTEFYWRMRQSMSVHEVSDMDALRTILIVSSQWDDGPLDPRLALLLLLGLWQPEDTTKKGQILKAMNHIK